jgi:signal transduction histidine kinase
VDRSLGIEGSGFGLDSCRKVLEAHGGRLEAASEPGRGSTFSAVFPRRLRI